MAVRALEQFRMGVRVGVGGHNNEASQAQGTTSQTHVVDLSWDDGAPSIIHEVSFHTVPQAQLAAGFLGTPAVALAGGNPGWVASDIETGNASWIGRVEASPVIGHDTEMMGLKTPPHNPVITTAPFVVHRDAATPTPTRRGTKREALASPSLSPAQTPHVGQPHNMRIALQKKAYYGLTPSSPAFLPSPSSSSGHQLNLNAKPFTPAVSPKATTPLPEEPLGTPIETGEWLLERVKEFQYDGELADYEDLETLEADADLEPLCSSGDTSSLNGEDSSDYSSEEEEEVEDFEARKKNEIDELRAFAAVCDQVDTRMETLKLTMSKEHRPRITSPAARS